MALPKLSNWNSKSWKRFGAAAPHPFARFKRHFQNKSDRPIRPCKPWSIGSRQRKRFAAPKKISNAHIFEAVISRSSAQRRLIDEFLGLFGGRSQPVMAHLIEAGKLTLEDVQEAEKVLRGLAKKG